MGLISVCSIRIYLYLKQIELLVFNLFYQNTLKGGEFYIVVLIKMRRRVYYATSTTSFTTCDTP
jgi:hypothetical protein